MDNNATLKANGSKVFVVIRGEEDDSDVRDVLETFDNLQDAIKFRNEVFLEAQGYDPEEFNDPVAMKEIMEEMENYVEDMGTCFVSNGTEFFEVKEKVTKKSKKAA